jgi:hypothetical protein
VPLLRPLSFQDAFFPILSETFLKTRRFPSKDLSTATFLPDFPAVGVSV